MHSAFSLPPFSLKQFVDATPLSLDYALRTETDPLVHIFISLAGRDVRPGSYLVLPLKTLQDINSRAVSAQDLGEESGWLNAVKNLPGTEA